ncbi:glycosyltransferase family 4 protein [Arthrobacter mobilis]|uniref:Glycosyltransferase family 4 protein n=1 Tax=Arthrobacter mobilis TaxID=2724944 RepID=A0A7X6K563_9MICC|nr:glycosyltransferase family 4 protein [Arthrobacter mobilis]NKX53844.1 glycosyltransferase family 4 protein [Arthrobacter mobilis]
MAARILCISFSDIAADSRVLRQLALLAEAGEVTTLSYGSRPPGAGTHLGIDPALPSLPQTPAGVLKLGLRRHGAVELEAPAVRQALELVAGRQFDLVVANEARALPLAHAVAGGAPVWGDMHEWAPEERAHVLPWRLLVKPYMYAVCAKYLPRTAAVTTVNASIAALYTEQFGCPVEVVRNAGPFRDLEPSAPVPGRIRLAHSGAAVPGRNLEGTIEAVKALDERFSLDLYLVKARDGGRYWQRLRELAAGDARITFHDAVAPDALPRTLNQYDVGVFSLPPQTTNHRLMLPNKFFDFVQARLALVFSPSPETSRLMREHGLGVVADDFSTPALVRALSALTPELVERYKANTHRAARALSSAEDEAVTRGILRRLLGS